MSHSKWHCGICGKSDCKWRPSPPNPPPMRGPAKESGIGGYLLIIIFTLATGVTAGWQMHGGVCL